MPQTRDRRTLSDCLHDRRRRTFVGRTREQELFAAAIAAPALPFHLLVVQGPGGIGKTSLLGQFYAQVIAQSVPALWLDARNVPPDPGSITRALCCALGKEDESVAAALGGAVGRHVLFLDAYELLAPADDWLREILLPQLPDDWLVVVSSRQPLPHPCRPTPVGRV